MHNKLYIILGSILACVLLFFIEYVLTFDYIYKTIAKWTVFCVIPLLYWLFLRNDQHTAERNRGAAIVNWQSITLAIVVFYSIVQVFYLFHPYIDTDVIRQQLNERNVTVGNFLLVGIYIIVGNSLLEELFFRGFIFLNLYRLNKKTAAYVLSSVLFALYHIGIFLTWFEVKIIVIVTFGLFLAGVVFNALNTRSGTIINSWIVHAAADSAIIFIGFMFVFQ